MAKVINCKDVGFDCDGVVRAATEDEALRLAAEHAKAVHGLYDEQPTHHLKRRQANLVSCPADHRLHVGQTHEPYSSQLLKALLNIAPKASSDCA